MCVCVCARARGQKGEGNRRGARAGGMENGGGEREDRRVCVRRRERGIEGGREDWGGQEAREREGRGASERLVVVKTLSSWLEGRYCGI